MHHHGNGANCDKVTEFKMGQRSEECTGEGVFAGISARVLQGSGGYSVNGANFTQLAHCFTLFGFLKGNLKRKICGLLKVKHFLLRKPTF